MYGEDRGEAEKAGRTGEKGEGKRFGSFAGSGFQESFCTKDGVVLHNLNGMKLVLFTFLVMSGFCMNAEAQSSTQGKKVLVAYFSRSGNTRAVAEDIQKLTGGDMFEIQTSKPYPAEYHACTVLAKKEKEEGTRPALKTKVENMGQYDVVFVGYPNWWGTMPMAVVTFLEGYDLAGKTLVPFCTHGGGGEQRCFTDFVKYIGKAAHKPGFLIGGGEARGARKQVESWLEEIEVVQ